MSVILETKYHPPKKQKNKTKQTNKQTKKKNQQQQQQNQKTKAKTGQSLHKEKQGLGSKHIFYTLYFCTPFLNMFRSKTCMCWISKHMHLIAKH